MRHNGLSPLVGERGPLDHPKIRRHAPGDALIWQANWSGYQGNMHSAAAAPAGFTPDSSGRMKSPLIRTAMAKCCRHSVGSSSSSGRPRGQASAIWGGGCGARAIRTARDAIFHCCGSYERSMAEWQRPKENFQPGRRALAHACSAHGT